ncbi:C-type lectin-like [Trinorchestia longiramus]|nr:C-type lectin-like [Trinorchestia longiramus]
MIMIMMVIVKMMMMMLRDFLVLSCKRKLLYITSSTDKDQVLRETFDKVQTLQQKNVFLLVDEVQICPTVSISAPQPPCNQAYIKKKFTAVEDMYCLYFSEDVLKWDEAVNECTKLNAQLASLSYDLLYTAVVKYHKEHHGDKDWWVNLSWNDGEWKWGDGTPHSSETGSGFWASGQPNKYRYDSVAAVMKAYE